MQAFAPALGVFRRQSSVAPANHQQPLRLVLAHLIVISASARSTSDGNRSPHSTSTSASCRSSISQTPAPQAAPPSPAGTDPGETPSSSPLVLMHQRERRARHIVRLRRTQRTPQSPSPASSSPRPDRPAAPPASAAGSSSVINSPSASVPFSLRVRSRFSRVNSGICHRSQLPNTPQPGNPRQPILILHPRPKRLPQMIHRIHRQHRMLILRQAPQSLPPAHAETPPPPPPRQPAPDIAPASRHNPRQNIATSALRHRRIPRRIHRDPPIRMRHQRPPSLQHQRHAVLGRKPPRQPHPVRLNLFHVIPTSRAISPGCGVSTIVRCLPFASVVFATASAAPSFLPTHSAHPHRSPSAATRAPQTPAQTPASFPPAPAPAQCPPP